MFKNRPRNAGVIIKNKVARFFMAHGVLDNLLALCGPVTLTFDLMI